VPLPTVKTDLHALAKDQDTVIWLGHSSYFVQLSGKRILIDPVFSAFAAPVPGMVRAFDGTSVYTAQDMPPIDYLLITHDHYDHLDYTSMRELQAKTRYVIGGLGTGAHFEHWGYPSDKIREGDWYSVVQLEPGIAIHVLPARHYSGRTLTRNKTLWVAYAIETPQRRLFFSGDSGFGPHFAEIARRFGGFDLAALDAGQYNQRWPYIHMNPEEAARAAEILRAKTVLPAHVGRFTLARHAWDEPFQRLAAASKGKPFRLLTPRIGDPIQVGNSEQLFERWWEGMH
jgi:L-ascorbate metabolism protein UlaG (beta-lactamase superfamily)